MEIIFGVLTIGNHSLTSQTKVWLQQIDCKPESRNWELTKYRHNKSYNYIELLGQPIVQQTNHYWSSEIGENIFIIRTQSLWGIYLYEVDLMNFIPWLYNSCLHLTLCWIELHFIFLIHSITQNKTEASLRFKVHTKQISNQCSAVRVIAHCTLTSLLTTEELLIIACIYPY